ncbi:MAG: hypothetical protein ABII76_12325 [Pseudomonadota bacterium]
MSGPEALEADWAVLAVARDRFVKEYDRQCAAANRQRRQAGVLRRQAKRLPADSGEREEIEALALDLERAPIDHARAMQIVALLTDAARKAQDSLAVQRPSTHTRVHVEVMVGGQRIGGSGPAAPTYVDDRTDADAAIMAELNGTADALAASADPEQPAP